jgi:hypothetical protein
MSGRGATTPGSAKRPAGSPLSGDGKRQHRGRSPPFAIPPQAPVFQSDSPAITIYPRTAKSHGLSDETAKLLSKRLNNINSISELVSFTDHWRRLGNAPLDNATVIGDLLKQFVATLVILYKAKIQA